MKGILCNFFTGLSYRHVSFVWCKFFYRTPPFCKHSSIVYNVFNLTSLVLNNSGHSEKEQWMYLCETLEQCGVATSDELQYPCSLLSSASMLG